MEIFSKRLRQLRVERGLTQGELAERLGIARNSIFSYETSRRVPDIDVLAKLAEFFEVTSDYLVGLEDCRQNKDMSAQLKIAAEMRGLLRDKRPIIGAGNALIVTEELWLKIADAVEGKCALWQEKWN